MQRIETGNNNNNMVEKYTNAKVIMGAPSTSCSGVTSTTMTLPTGCGCGTGSYTWRSTGTGSNSGYKCQ